MKNWFGFHDHIVNPRSGRPEAHQSWIGEATQTWVVWAMAVISLVGAFFYWAKWGDVGGMAPVATGGVLFVAMAIWRRQALNRKKAALIRAVQAYEAALEKAALRFG